MQANHSCILAAKGKTMMSRSRRRKEQGHRIRGIFLTFSMTAITMFMVTVGCGGDAGPTDTLNSDAIDTLETDTGDQPGGVVLHADLSGLDADETAWLHVGARVYPMKAHTDETRDLYLNQNGLQGTIDDEDVTHYAEGVDLPDDRVALMWVTHSPEDDRDGEHGLGLVGLHIPQVAMEKARTLRAYQGWPRYQQYLDNPMPKRNAQFVPKKLVKRDANDDPDDMLTPLDTAKALLFHHPAVTSLDPDVAALVMTHIENAVGLSELTDAISAQGRAYEHDDDYEDGWAVLVPILDEEGNRRMKSDGTPYYHYVLSDRTAEEAETAVKSLLRAAHNDLELRDKTWHVQDGTGAIDASPEPVATHTLRAAGAYDWTLDYTNSRSGLEARVEALSNNPDNGLRRVKIGLKNHWLRHLTFYVGFVKADGTRMTIPASMATSHDDKDHDIMYVGKVPPVVEIMSIPLPADWVDFTIDVPNEAQSIEIMGGGLGTGKLDYPKVANNGMIMTFVFEYGIPLFFLAAGVGIENTSWYKDLMADDDLVFAIIAVAGFLLAGENAAEIGLGGSPKAVLSRSATLVGNLILSKACSKLATYVTKKLTEAELEGAIPFVGWGLRMLSVSATLSAVAQTTAEVTSSPWVIKNGVTPTMDMQVTIFHDPDDYQFPATATKYQVIATYADKKHRILPMRALPGTTVSDPIVVEFEDVPAGGTVEVTVGFFAQNNWLAGRGSTGRVANLVPSGQDKLKLDITLEEIKVPLDQTTNYHHKQKLNYASGKYQWVAGDAPTETLSSLSCANVGSHLCSLDNITFSQRAGMFGYSWQAAGPNMAQCDTGTTDMQLHFVQNMSAKADPNIGYKTLDCGMSEKTTIVYELMGPENGTGMNFFLDTRNGNYHLRRVVADESTPMSSSGLSWGRFTQPLDDIAINDAGYVVGANWSNSKLEILTIPAQGSSDDAAPWARLLGGEGTREGLMYGPKAIAFTAEGVLLVLETLNKRIQALDIDGNPVKYFNDKQDYFADLFADTELVTYLDMGVEFMGYIYVLSYVNDGSNVNDYRLDIYDPQGEFLSRTIGVAAHKMTVDFWRNVYSLNYQSIAGPGGRTEPSVSEWIPSTPNP